MQLKNLKFILRKLQRLIKLNNPVLFDLSDNLVLNTMEHFPQLASVLKIKQERNSSDCFSFKSVTIECICKEIVASDASKATQSDDMPTKIIKNLIFFQPNFINAVEASIFPEQLKYAVKLIFKKES